MMVKKKWAGACKSKVKGKLRQIKCSLIFHGAESTAFKKCTGAAGKQKGGSVSQRERVRDRGMSELGWWGWCGGVRWVGVVPSTSLTAAGGVPAMLTSLHPSPSQHGQRGERREKGVLLTWAPARQRPSILIFPLTISFF